MSWTEIMIAIKKGLVASAESVSNIVSGTTKVGKAIADGEGYEIADYYVKRAVQVVKTLPTPTKECNYYVQAADDTFPYEWGQLEIRKGSDGSEYVALFKTTGDNNGIYYNSWRNGATAWSGWKNIFNADTLDGFHASSFLQNINDKVSTGLHFSKLSSIGKSTIYKNNSATADYGLIIRDENVNGENVELLVRVDMNAIMFKSKEGTTNAILHTGNSTKVIVSATAPTDTTAVWIVPN